MAKLSPSPENQISLFVKKESPDPFRKAVQIVHSMPLEEITAVQRRVMNNWLKKANSSDPDQEGYWTVRIEEMSTEIGFNSKNRKYLKDAARDLQRIVFAWDVVAPELKRAKWKSSVLFPDVEITSETIRFRVGEQLKPHVLNPEMYALIDQAVVKKYRRVASIGIYEHCVRYERIGTTTTVPWQKFRDIVLGESSNRKTYEQYKVFKAKVLNPSIAEINAEGAINIVLRETKAGRSVEGVFFKVAKGRPETEAGALDENDASLVTKMVKLGILTSEAKRLLKDHAQKDIKGALAYTHDRKNNKKIEKLENPAAYFRMALSKKWFNADDVEDVEAKPETANRTAKTNLDALFRVHQIAEAEGYFKVLDADDQQVLIGRYNDQQPTAGLRLKSKATKPSEVAFFQWLMVDLWGEPTPEHLLEFAQNLLSKTPRNQIQP